MSENYEYKKIRQDYHNGVITAQQAIKIYRKMNSKYPSEAIQFEIAVLEFTI